MKFILFLYTNVHINSLIDFINISIFWELLTPGWSSTPEDISIDLFPVVFIAFCTLSMCIPPERNQGFPIFTDLRRAQSKLIPFPPGNEFILVYGGLASKRRKSLLSLYCWLDLISSKSATLIAFMMGSLNFSLISWILLVVSDPCSCKICGDKL